MVLWYSYIKVEQEIESEKGIKMDTNFNLVVVGFYGSIKVFSFYSFEKALKCARDYTGNKGWSISRVGSGVVLAHSK